MQPSPPLLKTRFLSKLFPLRMAQPQQVLALNSMYKYNFHLLIDNYRNGSFYWF